VKRIAPAVVIALLVGACTSGGDRVEGRVDDLLAGMTLDEKIGQMTLVELNSIRPKQVTEWMVGGILSGGGGSPAINTPAAWVEMTSGYQRAALETRLGIPILFGSDAIHGHNNLLDATIFPHNVGLGAAGSAELVERIAAATAAEAMATGVNWNFAPVVAVPRDIRWGRTYEGFGEDTFLVAELGAAYVRGLQGADLGASDTMLATAKHFVADGGTEWGTSTTSTYWIDQGDALVDEETLRAVHLAPYRDAIDAGALSIMASYSSWQGTKLHAHEYLLTDVLKGELGFTGFVVSDWEAIDQIYPDDYYASVVAAINAGVDMNMVPTDYPLFVGSLRAAVESGDVPMERIDDAVRRILRAKFNLGLFESPHPDPALLGSIGSEEHRGLASEAVMRSMVLLTNDEATLPISADDIGLQSGGWTITWQGGSGAITEGSTILEGIEARSGSAAVFHDPAGRFDEPDVPDRADVGIVVVSETPYAEGIGDNGRLTLDRREEQQMLAVRDRVDSLVVIVLSGRPLVMGDLLVAADVLVAAWLPGSEGAAVAGPLFGDAPFTGKLTYSWPWTAGQLPFEFPVAATGCDAPAFPYGHGLTVDETHQVERPDCDEKEGN
jgi:beta-glucosidase